MHLGLGATFDTGAIDGPCVVAADDQLRREETLLRRLLERLKESSTV
ncbi:MAG TPA: hypothetical protein VND64_18975 [Pirellulales bacterium]|nr:hypothetical protein [Pirellulales bacterium]